MRAGCSRVTAEAGRALPGRLRCPFGGGRGRESRLRAGSASSREIRMLEGTAREPREFRRALGLRACRSRRGGLPQSLATLAGSRVRLSCRMRRVSEEGCTEGAGARRWARGRGLLLSSCPLPYSTGGISGEGRGRSFRRAFGLCFPGFAGRLVPGEASGGPMWRRAVWLVLDAWRPARQAVFRGVPEGLRLAAERGWRSCICFRVRDGTEGASGKPAGLFLR